MGHTKKQSQKGSKGKGSKNNNPSAKGQERSKLEARSAGKKDAKQKLTRNPPKRTPEKTVDKERSISRYFRIAMQFLRESRSELKKVKWPTRKELLASTAVVIFLVILVSFFLGLVDFGLIKIIKNIVG
jgi:preprotein translocase subunit SecE